MLVTYNKSIRNPDPVTSFSAIFKLDTYRTPRKLTTTVLGHEPTALSVCICVFSPKDYKHFTAHVYHILTSAYPRSVKHVTRSAL